MPVPLTATIRQDVWRLHLGGASAASIAQSCGLHVRSVRRLLGRFRLANGPCAPSYDRCGRHRAPQYLPLLEPILALRRRHPDWGAGRILAELSQSRRFEALPNRSSVKRWLAAAGLAPCPRPGHPPPPRADRVHQIWQMDACEKIPLADRSRVCWLRLVDEFSGAFLFTRVFACPHWNDVPKLALQAALRQAFARWGRPDGLRVDHGNPWVRGGGLPSVLELWLTGLDVALHTIGVRRPQENGKVERSNGTTKRWAQPQQQSSAAELQQRIDEEDRIQREVFRGDDGLTRRERYPDLWYPGRGYWAGYETYNWDWQAALACLARRVVQRRVNQQGQVSLYDHHHRVGKPYAQQAVEVSFDPPSQQWRFRVGQVEVGSSPSRQITPERVKGLALESRQGRSARETAAKKAARGGSSQERTPAQQQ